MLKKWPRSQCARALKSLATLRLGREREALEQLEALAAEVPTDDAALLVMTVVYRETRRREYRSSSVLLVFAAAGLIVARFSGPRLPHVRGGRQEGPG